MINHIRSAFRSIRKHKSYAIINIVGLTLGLSAGLLVATVVIDDLSYDRFWKNSSRIYRVISVNKMGEGLSTKFPSSFAGLRHELPKNFAEVDKYVGISRYDLRLDPDSSGSEGVMIPVIGTDSVVWDLLNFDVVAGRPQVFVAGKKNLVITESLRDRIFAKEDPLGKIIKDVPAYGDKPSEFLVTGVIKDIPGNTHLRAEAIVVGPAHIEELNKKQWGSFMPAYVMLKPGADVNTFTKKVNAWYAKFVEVPDPYGFEFQPMEDVYLKSEFAQYQQIKGNLSNVYIFSGVAILLLVIACVNFINLSTARSVTRLRETAVMKVLGASKGMVISKFLAEALVIFFISTIAAIIVYQLSLGFVEMFLGHKLSQTFISRTGMLLVAVAVVAVIAVLTGLYPAWLISGFKTANSLKGSVFVHRANGQH
ncbi:MAG: ABC transporter permease, partial [Chitinophagaceae bacterium]